MGGSLSRSRLCPLFRDLPGGLCPPVQALARPRPLQQGDHHYCTGTAGAQSPGCWACPFDGGAISTPHSCPKAQGCPWDSLLSPPPSPGFLLALRL